MDVTCLLVKPVYEGEHEQKVGLWRGELKELLLDRRLTDWLQAQHEISKVCFKMLIMKSDS